MIDLGLHSTCGIDRYHPALLPVNRWLAQLGLVAPGGPLNDKNLHKAVTERPDWDITLCSRAQNLVKSCARARNSTFKGERLVYEHKVQILFGTPLGAFGILVSEAPTR